ncbi:Fic family protein [Pseudomonas sp. AMR01]|uniref:Fic family protein n=1 Tax=Pseudomonas sp. AMR01 TaxID=3064904 RepID=UPI0035BFC107
MAPPFWIWQHADWPHFHWQPERLAALLRECGQTQGRLLGMLGSVGQAVTAQNELDALLQNVLTSSAIEGEQLNVCSVRSSLARRLGLAALDDGQVSRRSEGLAELLMDATQQFAQPFTLARLLSWHHLLFPEPEEGFTTRALNVGSLRGDEPMQVVSGRLDRPTVHFEAPSRLGLGKALDEFLEWFEASRDQPELDPFIRAGVAHFWFVTLHPFDDGNGRLTRAIADLALAQGDHHAIRFYALSAAILEDRAGYYHALESSQKASLDITEWLKWFLSTLLRSLQQAMARIDRVLDKTRFWQQHRDIVLSSEQIKVLNRLLDGGEKGFEHGISASQYQAVAKVSKATATRHLADLLEKNCLVRSAGAGRSTRYQINDRGE